MRLVELRKPLLRYASGATLGSAYTGPGDIQAFTLWAGMRAYSAATTGTRAIRIRKDTGGAELDINTLADGSLDAAAIVAHLAGDTGHIVTWYDKVGTNHLTQATGSAQPVLTPNAIGTAYGATFTAGNASKLASTNLMGVNAQPYGFTFICKRASIVADGLIGIDTGGYAGWVCEPKTGSGGNLTAYAGGSFIQLYTTAVMAAFIHIANSSSSVWARDGSETTGDVGTQATTNNSLSVGNSTGGVYFTGVIMEVGFVAGTISSGNRTALNTNMHAAYGGW